MELTPPPNRWFPFGFFEIIFQKVGFPNCWTPDLLQAMCRLCLVASRRDPSWLIAAVCTFERKEWIGPPQAEEMFKLVIKSQPPPNSAIVHSSGSECSESELRVSVFFCSSEHFQPGDASLVLAEVEPKPGRMLASRLREFALSSTAIGLDL